MSFYPKKINERFYNLQNVESIEGANSGGTGASFTCGSYVKLYLFIDNETKEIKNAQFKSNGCGFALAAADVLTENLKGKRLNDLHGANNDELIQNIEAELGIFEASRRHCLELCLDALHKALKNFRLLQIEEFQGEKALICTCFGVEEETIERLIAEENAESVEEIGKLCNAGTGCGSCQFLIQELIDVFQLENSY
ncbi:MAG TPA: iron-sulfur cluster assembly scaffold protein [Pyrinomonadaceae bacterium]|nr:iron-sulfur cluster assembly scaffold protein [Pyrinomonadaceae bacterium]